jgi:hypothetical protein
LSSDDTAELVDLAAVRGGPTAPLLAVDGTQVAALVGPFVPDGHRIVAQILDVRFAFQEPQQLVNDRAQMEFLGSDQREPHP